MQRWPWFVAALAALNVLLLASNGILVAALKASRDGRTAEAVAGLEKERESLAGERARLAGGTARLLEAIGLLRELRSPTPSAAAIAEPVFDLQAEFPEIDLRSRPDPGSISAMEPEAFQDLLRKRNALPRELRGQILLSGDPDQVLASPLWNPNRRELGPAERAELANLLSDYRYYARLSHVERFNAGVEPELEKLRTAGAYIEYGSRESPPLIDGVRVVHTEPSDRDGYRRAYYFHANDYPAIAHHERVERERGLETFLAVYDLINKDKE